VIELGREISAAMSGKEPIFVGVLKGSAIFLADLARSLTPLARFDLMSISAYAGGSSSGVVQIVKDLDHDIAGQDVIIVEDIVDTGLTLNYLRRTLEERAPSSLQTVTLLDKAARRIVPVQVEWRGFEIPDLYVLGYGMDHGGLYRNLKDLYVAPDIKRLAAQPDMYLSELYPDHLPDAP
jgi:hypoxanthine phosphoribosyltransferase